MLVTTSVSDLAANALRQLGYADKDDFKNTPVRILKEYNSGNSKIEASSYAFIQQIYYGLGDVIDHETVTFKIELMFPVFPIVAPIFLNKTIMITCIAKRSGELFIVDGDDKIAFTDFIAPVNNLESAELNEFLKISDEYATARDRYYNISNIAQVGLGVIFAICIAACGVCLLLPDITDIVTKIILGVIALACGVGLVAVLTDFGFNKQFKDTRRGKAIYKRGNECMMRILRMERNNAA